jgi:hypothetical protein
MFGIVTAAATGVGASYLAEVALVTSDPWIAGRTEAPRPLAAIEALGPHGLVATLLGIFLAPSIAMIVNASIDRPSLRRALGVPLAAAAAAGLVVALVQSSAGASPVAGDNLTLIEIGLGALTVGGAWLAIYDREPVSVPLPGGVRLMAALIPLGLMLALGWATLVETWIVIDAPPPPPPAEAVPAEVAAPTAPADPAAAPTVPAAAPAVPAAAPTPAPAPAPAP